MSTKKGYIVQDANANWLIVEFPYHYKGGYGEKYSIHPGSLPTILSNGTLKREYQGEVEYEEAKVPCWGKVYLPTCSKCGFDYSKSFMKSTVCFNTTTYAIPKPVESKGDVWEEAMSKAHDYAEKEGNGFYTMREYREHQLDYLKQHYTLTQKQ